MRIADGSSAVPLVGLALLTAATAAEAGSWRAGLTADYTTGDYGGTGTINQVYVPFSAGYRADRWGVRLTVPYVRVDGPGTLIDPGGEFVSGPDRSRSGLGDVILGATLYDVARSDAGDFHLDIGAKVKLGTADESEGLGTGETDYSVQVDLLKDFDRFALFATGGYKWRGDPSGVDLRDRAYGLVGGDYLFGERARLGLMYGYRPSAIDGADPLSEATIYVTFSQAGVTFQPYVVSGFTDGSPDWGAGLAVGWRPRTDR